MSGHTLGTLDLPRGLVWSDEYSWTPVKSEQRWSTTGAQLLHVGVKQSGRPITLTAANDAGWVRRDVLESLRVMAADPVGQWVLTLADGRRFTVRFAPVDEPIQARSVGRPELPGDQHPYVATVRLVDLAIDPDAEP